jgi:CheY-like chemotaxis protein
MRKALTQKSRLLRHKAPKKEFFRTFYDFFKLRPHLCIFDQGQTGWQHTGANGIHPPRKEDPMVPCLYVLFADPSPHICQLLQRELRMLPCRAHAFCTGHALMERIQQDVKRGITPDLVVLDPDLADIRREDLLAALHMQLPATPLVLHSLHARERHKQEMPLPPLLIFLEKNDSSHIRIRRLIETRIQRQGDV